MMRIDDPIDQRKHDLASELQGERTVLLVYPAGRSNTVYVILDPEWTTPSRRIFSTARDYGYSVTSMGTKAGDDIRSSFYAFNGRYPDVPRGQRFEYIELNPVGVPMFTCDWCDETYRGKSRSRRYNAEVDVEPGHPDELFTLCRSCDPHYTADGEFVAEVDHPRLRGC